MRTSSKLQSQIHNAINLVASTPCINLKRGLTLSKVIYNAGVKNSNAITLLRKVLFTENLLVEYSDYISWNKAYSLPTDKLCDRIFLKVSNELYKPKRTEIVSSVLSKIKSDKLTIKDFTDTELVSELRKRGFDVKCEKILCL